MATPTITGTASGSITLACSQTVAAAVWGTVGSPTVLAIINPGDVPAYVLLGTGTVAGNPLTVNQLSGSIPIPPGQIVFLATGSNTQIAGITLRNVTTLTIVPST